MNYRYQTKNRRVAKNVVSLFAVALVIAAFVAYPACYRTSAEVVTVVVKNKESVAITNGSKYLIYTSGGVYENTDSFLFGKFNASDVYNNIEPGKKYRFTVAGWRIPFFSSYQNIVDVTPL